MNPARTAPIALVAITLLLSACSSPSKSAETKDKPKAAKQETYYQVESTGSWIPRKVRKKEDLMGSAVTAVEGEAMQKAIDAGATRHPKDADILSTRSAPTR